MASSAYNPVAAVQQAQVATTDTTGGAVLAPITDSAAALRALGTSGGAGVGFDGLELSDELADESSLNPFLAALNPSTEATDPSAVNDPNATDTDAEAKDKQRKADELRQQIQDKQQELDAAIQSGDSQKAQAVAGELTQLMQELSTLIGGGGNSGGGDASNPIQAVDAAGAGDSFPSGGGFAPAGGGGGGGYVPSGGGGGPASGGGGVSGGGDTSSAGDVQSVPPPPLEGDDKKLASWIDNYLQQQGSPAASQHAGELMVQYGRQYKVDPLVLLSIAGQETQYGKLGVGVNGMLGVGAYDSDPNNSTRNPTFSGVANQIRIGAQTFAKLRAKGGSNENASIADQASAVNRAGWATDQRWHNGVTSIYNRIAGQAS